MVTLTDLTTEEQITAVHELPEGTIVKVEGDYEGIVRRLKASATEGVGYKEIHSGNSLFALYGPQCLIKYDV